MVPVRGWPSSSPNVGGGTPKPEDLRYVKESGRGMLTAVPSPYWGRLPAEDAELARRDMELYRFFRCEGLAGRWSYVFHPTVEGDPEYYYFQRTSHDRRKACVILTHRAEKPVVVHPRGLLPEAKYVVGFDSTQATTERTGADLMTNGIAIKDQKPGELIYLNLPNRPGSGQDKVPPQSPGRVLVRRETNLGHGGAGVYWSPGTDDNWISYYEVRRDGTILDKVAIGVYYFDHAAGWDKAREYAVRTVDGDGNASDWRIAERTTDEPLTFAALGRPFRPAGTRRLECENDQQRPNLCAHDVGAAGEESGRRFRRNAEPTRAASRGIGKAPAARASVAAGSRRRRPKAASAPGPRRRRERRPYRGTCDARVLSPRSRRSAGR